MDADDSPVIAARLFELIDSQNLTGSWRWVFATGEQTWSPGMYRLLGLETAAVKPSYALLRELVHPEDRDKLPKTSAIRQGSIKANDEFRIVHPQGQIRTLSVRHDIIVASDGRPLAVAGVIFDITEQSQLRQALAREKQRSSVMAREHFILNYASPESAIDIVDFDCADVLFPSLDEIACDPYLIVAFADRARARDSRSEARSRGCIARGVFDFRQSDGTDILCRAIEVPVRDEAGRIVEWRGLIAPLSSPAQSGLALRWGLEQAIRAEHFRAARALLGWSMLQLAAASGLSFSSVRRQEDDTTTGGQRTRSRIVAALQGAGIRFVTLENGMIAVTKS